MSRFSPLCTWDSGVEKAHGRIGRRTIDVLPAAAAGIEREWPKNLPCQTLAPVQEIRRVATAATRGRSSHLQHERRLAAGSADQQSQSFGNRDHASQQDVILGEDGYTNRCDNAPRNIFSLTGFVLKILKFVAHSPTRAIEQFQDNKNRAIRPSQDFTKSP